jgi:hypothetical protein
MLDYDNLENLRDTFVFLDKGVFNVDTTSIEIVKGDFKGVVYRYTHVRINPDDDGRISFGYEIMKPTNTEKINKKQFEDLIFNILFFINTLVINMKEYVEEDME